jgi:hypothetical protein
LLSLPSVAKPESQLAANLMIAPWQLWKLIWIDLVLSYTNPTFFEPAAVHPIQKIRWVMTLEMFGGLFSGNVRNALWQTFAEVVLMRQLRAMLNPRPSHTPWGTPYTPQMPCSARIAL